MNLDSSVSLKERKGRKSPFFEVTSTEKQLWGLIHSKGILHTEVHDLYRKTRSGYEKIILNNHKEVELRDVECSLWMLHYMHIDEFRKRIVQTSASSDQSLKSGTRQNATNSWSSIESHKEQFKSFLLEAIQFYQDLIAKLRRRYGLPEDPLAYENDGISCDIDFTKFHLCQYSCHRLLVCLGDLARYRELCKKLDFQKPVCHLSLDSSNPESGIAIELGCSCKDDLAAAHKNCAESWFKIRGNKTCEICNSVARNVFGPVEIEPTQQTAVETNVGSAANAVSVPEAQSCLNGPRVVNFLLGCMVFAFVISWLFHFNIPS